MRRLRIELALACREWSAVLLVIAALLAVTAAAFLPLGSARDRLASVRLDAQEAQDSFVLVQQKTRKQEAGYTFPMDYELPGVPDSRQKLYNFHTTLPPAPLVAAVSSLPDDPPTTLSIYNNNDEHPSLLTGRGRLLSNVSSIVSPSNLLTSFQGHFDLLFVVTAVLPLLIIGLSFDLIATDAQTNTLALLVAQGISMWRLALSRVIARVLLFLVPVLGCMFLLLFWTQSRVGLPPKCERTSEWVAVSAAYLLFWFAASLLANITLRQPLRVALSLFSLWLASVVLLPMGVGLAVRIKRPVVPSLLLADREKLDREEANEDMQHAYTATMESFHQHTRIDPLNVAPQERPRYMRMLRTERFAVPHGVPVLDCYFANHPSAPDGKAFHYQQWYAAQIGRDCFLLRRFGSDLLASEAASQRQSRAAERASLFSPTMVARQALTAVAGADNSRYASFLDQFDAYMRLREEFFGSRMRAYRPILSEDLEAYSLFHFSEPPVHRKRMTLLLGYLLALSGAALGGAWLLGNKDVRNIQ